MSKTPQPVRHAIQFAPDLLEEAYKVACARDRSKGATWNRNFRTDTDKPYRLHVEHGEARHPGERPGGFWSQITLWSASKGMRLDGVFGYPCVKALTGVVAIPHQAIHELLVSRGWNDLGHTTECTGQWLASHPDIPVIDWTRQRHHYEWHTLIDKLTLELLEDLIQVANLRRFQKTLEG